MKKIIIATTNENKVVRLKELLKKLDYEVIGLAELDEDIPDVNETETTPEGIAIQKAIHYVKYVPDGSIILTQDDTIKFEKIAADDDPKMSIKSPVKKKYGEFNDKLATQYYTELASKYGGIIPMTYIYGHAVAVKDSSIRPIVKVVGGESKIKARLVEKPYLLKTVPGYFLSSITQVQLDGTWRYFSEIDKKEQAQVDRDLYISICNLLNNLENNKQ